VNSSLIVSRYARALVKYVRETGHGKAVFSEAGILVKALEEVPGLERMIQSRDVISDHEKVTLLHTALGQPMSHEMESFIRLLAKNGRLTEIRFILKHFQALLLRSEGVRNAVLTCATEPSPMLLQRLKALVKAHTGDDVVIRVRIDHDIIGGFVFDMDDYLMDASVKGQLEKIRQDFHNDNRRII